MSKARNAPLKYLDTLPEWLKNAITLERLAMNVKALKGEEMTGTDAEACAYLYTAALTQPMEHDWGQIYLYVVTKTYHRWGKNEMPGDIAVDKLDDEQMKDLNRLREWLYRERPQVRLERDRVERRQKREEEAEKKRRSNRRYLTSGIIRHLLKGDWGYCPQSPFCF